MKVMTWCWLQLVKRYQTSFPFACFIRGQFLSLFRKWISSLESLLTGEVTLKIRAQVNLVQHATFIVLKFNLITRPRDTNKRNEWKNPFNFLGLCPVGFAAKLNCYISKLINKYNRTMALIAVFNILYNGSAKPSLLYGI